MARVEKNILANLIGKGCNVLFVYLFVPFYLKYLGIEAFGIVGFFAVLHGVLGLADLGLTATLSREMARLSGVPDSADRMRSLVRTVEFVYIALALVVCLAVALLAVPIADHWLTFETLQPDVVVRSIRLMGVAIALQLPARLFLGGLLGLQKQVVANAIQASMGLVRGGGATLVLWLVSPTVGAFFLWQAATSLALLLLARHFLWRSLPKRKKGIQVRFGMLRSVGKYTAGMASISICSVILMQLDKLAVSKMLSLEVFGYYTLAVTLSQVPVLLGGPIADAVFPRLTRLMAAGRHDDLVRDYHRYNQIVAALVFPVGLTMSYFAREIIFLWTRSADASAQAHVAASLLLIGSIALAIQFIPFRLALAHAWTRLPLVISLCMIIVITPLLIGLIHLYGVTGAGMSWVALNGVSAPFLVVLLHRRLLKGEAGSWFTRDMLWPLSASVACLAFAHIVCPADLSGMSAVLAITVTGAIALGCSLILTFGRPDRILRQLVSNGNGEQ